MSTHSVQEHQQLQQQQMSKILSLRGALIACITIILLNRNVASGTTDEETTTDPANQLLEVKVYYEALCPDSVRFIRYQLYDAMIYKKFMNFTDLKFIPYGKVTTWVDPTTNKEYLNCQHGYRECQLNALHACIVEHNTQREQMLLIDCILGRYTLEECAKEIQIDVTEALKCNATRSVEDILKKYGMETDEIDLWFVPSIGINGRFSQGNQDLLRLHFVESFCETYKLKYHVTLENCPK